MAGNTVKFKAVLDDKVSSPLDKMRGKFDTLGTSKGFKAVAQGIGIGAGIGALNLLSSAIGGVTDFLGDSVAAYNEDQKSIANLDASLKANIAGWNGNRDAIEGVLTQRMALGFSDEEQRSSLAKLVAATHDVNAALAIQRTAMDLARFKGISLADATDALTKVEAGSYRVLKGLGIQLKEGATQTEALAAVQAVATGQAAAYANTNEGKVLVSQIKVNEAQEKLGKTMANFQAMILPAVAEGITGVVNALDSLGVGSEQTMDKAAAAAGKGSQSAEFALKRMQAQAEATANGWDTSTNRIMTDVEHMKGGIGSDTANIRGNLGALDKKTSATADSMKRSFETVGAALRRLGDDALNAYFDPLIENDRLLADEARLSAAQRILASGKATEAEKRDARATIHELTKQTTASRLKLLEAGKLSRKEQGTLLHDLKEDYKHATGDAKTKIAQLIAKIEELQRHRRVDITVVERVMTSGGHGKEGPKGFAGGGHYEAGVPRIVGEDGPEFDIPDHSGTVVSNSALRMSSRTAPVIHNYIYLDGNQLAEAVDAHLYRKYRRTAATGGRV